MEQIAIGLSFESDWLREWRKFSKPTTRRSISNFKRRKSTYLPQVSLRFELSPQLVCFLRWLISAFCFPNESKAALGIL